MLLGRRAAVLMATLAFAAQAADDAAPLSLEQALAATAQRPPDRVLADTRGIPYGRLSPPRMEFIAHRDAARIETMARYLDVVLVDLDEMALSERMSTAYVAFDRLRHRAPDAIDTLRAQADYQELLSHRNAARVRQRLARSALALAMGTPGKLRAELVDPRFEGEDASASASEQRPGGDAGEDRDARRAHARAGAALEIEWLARSERPRVRARTVLAARILDDTRARYDAGEPADLGNAMAATVEAQRDERSVDFALALARERLKALAVR